MAAKLMIDTTMPTWACQHKSAQLLLLGLVGVAVYCPRGLNYGRMANKSIGALLVAERYNKMTPEERSAAAKNAAVKRWAAVGKKVKAKKAAKKGKK